MTVRIETHALGKRYLLSHDGAKYRTLREDLMRGVAAPWQALVHKGGRAARRDEIWALRDLSFDVSDGEVFGIIGRNGAGKSTLLKILSRIVHPSTGKATIRGRVGTLLEVGAGFHPELTGRDNVYLSGAILGMTRQEITKRFDEIVDFSGVQRFLDTPVKRYSTGMYMRLAFAVAAHLEADILIVDEVLAVGDAEFQEKCLGRMRAVAGSGRTVLFVSHNLTAVRSLCTRAGLMVDGRFAHYGDVQECIHEYLKWNSDEAGASVVFAAHEGSDPRMTSATLLADGNPATRIFMGSELSVRIAFSSREPILRPYVELLIHSEAGDALVNAGNRYQPSAAYETPVSAGTIHCDMGAVPLCAGRYSLSLRIGDYAGETHEVAHAITFEVVERDVWGLGQQPEWPSPLWWATTFRCLP